MNRPALIRTCMVWTCLTTMFGCGETKKTSQQSSSEVRLQDSMPILKDAENAQFAKLIADCDDAVLLDVRTPEEWDQGRIKGAIHADYWGDEAAFQAALNAIPRDQVVLVYCAGGGRSRLTAKELVDGGHQEVYNLEEGIAGWQEEGYPVVTGPSKAD